MLADPVCHTYLYIYCLSDAYLADKGALAFAAQQHDSLIQSYCCMAGTRGDGLG